MPVGERVEVESSESKYFTEIETKGRQGEAKKRGKNAKCNEIMRMHVMNFMHIYA